MLHLMTSTGSTVSLPRMAQAQSGPYTGTWWRLDEIVKRDTTHHVSASRKHKIGRHKITVLPEIFGLWVRETLNVIKSIGRRVLTAWRKIDEGLYMGALALIPLAYFERYHGAEWITESIHKMIEDGLIVTAATALPLMVATVALVSALRTFIDRRRSRKS